MDLEFIDSEISNLIKKEEKRQLSEVQLIASENFVSPAVREAVGSVLTNKYAEGYPGNRYYGGCEFVDEVENIAKNRLLQLFDAECANVQPHSGSQANQAVFNAVLNPGDTILGMKLSEGGHLTHGMPLNISGKLYNVVSYGLNENEEIDYEELEKLALKYKPKLIIAGASSYSLKIDFDKISDIAKSIGAYLMADIAHYSGLIAAQLYPFPKHADFITSTTHKGLRGPRGGFILMKEEFEKKINSSVFPGIQGGPLMHVIAGKAVAFKEANNEKFITYQEQVLKNSKAMSQTLHERGFRVISGRTESHMTMIDLTKFSITGKKAEAVLGDVNIICNKNAIPNDPFKPNLTSGIRVGSNAMTTLGFIEQDFIEIANLIADTIVAIDDNQELLNIKNKTNNLLERFAKK